MTVLLIFSVLVNLGLSIVAVFYIRKVAKLESKLRYTEACLEREEGNNRRMLEAIEASAENT